MDIDSYMGVVAPFAGNFAPRGWMTCSGQLLSIAQYSALFSLLGTTYGGNGSSTFGLPNLNGRVAMGAGGQYESGEMAGVENTMLLLNQLPLHSHTGNAQVDVVLQEANTPADTGQATASVTLGQSLGTQGRIDVAVQIYAPAPGSVQLPAQLHVNVQLAGSGQSQPVGILQPILTLTQCICVDGLYPSRP
ncbi:phage tail protein [Pseudomonas fluvialis]|uniref:phage tail protein n=1 Tax=Pseudomonas fluvialis TaxID=1793966 RepID=UPI00370A6213